MPIQVTFPPAHCVMLPRSQPEITHLTKVIRVLEPETHQDYDDSGETDTEVDPKATNPSHYVRDRTSGQSRLAARAIQKKRHLREMRYSRNNQGERNEEGCRNVGQR